MTSPHRRPVPFRARIPRALKTAVVVVALALGIATATPGPAQAWWMDGIQDGAVAYFDWADGQTIRELPLMAKSYCSQIATHAIVYHTDISSDLCYDFLLTCARTFTETSFRIEFKWYQYECISPAL